MHSPTHIPREKHDWANFWWIGVALAWSGIWWLGLYHVVIWLVRHALS